MNKYDRMNPNGLDGIFIQTKTTTKTTKTVVKNVIIRPSGRESMRTSTVRQEPFHEDQTFKPSNQRTFEIRENPIPEPTTPVHQSPLKTSNGSTERKIAFALANLYSDSNVEYDANRAISTIRKLFN